MAEDSASSATPSDTLVKYVVNECLRFTIHNRGKATKVQLKATLTSFYKDDEIITAKETLLTAVSNIVEATLPRISIRKGTNKTAGSAEDIIEILYYLDEKRLIEKLPSF